MTDFFDLLEGQLVDAAERRRAPSARPRLELLVATAAVAAAVALVVVLGGRSSATHNGRTPAGAPAIGAAAAGVPVAVLDAGRGRVPTEKLAYRISRATGAQVAIADASIGTLPDTDVMYAPGHGDAALAVSEFIGDLPEKLAAQRVGPLDAHSRRDARNQAQVVVRLGKDDIVPIPATAPVTFQDGCPGNARMFTDDDVQSATDSVLQAWPSADRAVVRSAHIAVDSPHAPEVTQACGERMLARTLVVELELTAREPARAVAFVSCDGDGWRVWRRG